MKKVYKKPVVVIESFQLDAAIAGNCKADAEAQEKKYTKLGYTEDTCTYAGGQYFNYDNCEVDLTGPEGDGNDETCYHGPLLAGGIVFINS